MQCHGQLLLLLLLLLFIPCVGCSLQYGTRIEVKMNDTCGDPVTGRHFKRIALYAYIAFMAVSYSAAGCCCCCRAHILGGNYSATAARTCLRCGTDVEMSRGRPRSLIHRLPATATPSPALYPAASCCRCWRQGRWNLCASCRHIIIARSIWLLRRPPATVIRAPWGRVFCSWMPDCAFADSGFFGFHVLYGFVF